MALWLAAIGTGCSPATPESQQPATYSDPDYYYQINVVRPDGQQPPFTPYGTPANSGTNSDYGRTIRPDSLSIYR
ncbi:hypothetical protein LOK74_03730 [Brevibacillus humidisoli]|uniref:hypothetical protein n=1 Tax=Brevibacillus humidisoli TaxID=2895522 RepID=UPI001E5C976E|nr:hypothetical protein [Brevibacillus humidisoli]UFJ41635.1 hypothetical protein LOK74_03730 [Brevibacillus humidisoli]